MDSNELPNTRVPIVSPRSRARSLVHTDDLRALLGSVDSSKKGSSKSKSKKKKQQLQLQQLQQQQQQQQKQQKKSTLLGRFDLSKAQQLQQQLQHHHHQQQQQQQTHQQSPHQQQPTTSRGSIVSPHTSSASASTSAPVTQRASSPTVVMLTSRQYDVTLPSSRGAGSSPVTSVDLTKLQHEQKQVREQLQQEIIQRKHRWYTHCNESSEQVKWLSTTYASLVSVKQTKQMAHMVFSLDSTLSQLAAHMPNFWSDLQCYSGSMAKTEATGTERLLLDVIHAVVRTRLTPQLKLTESVLETQDSGTPITAAKLIQDEVSYRQSSRQHTSTMMRDSY
jgi:hypothetical protein